MGGRGSGRHGKVRWRGWRRELILIAVIGVGRIIGTSEVVMHLWFEHARNI